YTPPLAVCRMRHDTASGSAPQLACGSVALQGAVPHAHRRRGMKRHTQWYGLALLLVAAGFVSPLVPRAAAQEAVVVGRITHTEGQVLRFVPETQDWVATVKDAPFGLHDTLYTDPQARAELMMPNGRWIRIGASTQIQPIALRSDASDIDLASGVARFYDNSAHGVVKATTPFGAVLAQPHATFDL